MMATAQHKATSAITSAEEQKPVQHWRSSPTSNTLLLNTGHTSCSSWGKVVGQRGFATVASQGKIQQRILHQRSGAYMTSGSSLQVEAAWVRGLSLETMPFWPGTSRETNSSPRKAAFHLKNTRGPVQTLEAPPLPCKSFGMEQVHGRKQLSIQNIWHELGFGICKTPCFSNIRSR